MINTEHILQHIRPELDRLRTVMKERLGKNGTEYSYISCDHCSFVEECDFAYCIGKTTNTDGKCEDLII